MLKPVKIDPVTNYRYYVLEQLPRVHRIMALKELGLSIKDVLYGISKGLGFEYFFGGLVVIATLGLLISYRAVSPLR